MAGDLRDFTGTYHYLKNNVLKYYNCDIYMQCYNTEHVEAALDLYRPKNYTVEDRESVTVEFDDICNKHTFGEVNVAGGFYQWRNVQKAFSLIDMHQKYDFILKSRYDISYRTPFFINFFNLNNNNYNIPLGGDWRGGLYDILALGSYENMKHYCNLYNVMSDYTVHDYIPSHSEILLKHHLEKTNIPINRFKYDIDLRRPDSDWHSTPNGIPPDKCTGLIYNRSKFKLID